MVSPFRLLSDSTMAASRSLGLAFRMPDKLVATYKNSYGIDIEANSGQTHHQLPVPAVFLVDTEGMIQFSYINPNFKVRADPGVILAAARVMAGDAKDGKE